MILHMATNEDWEKAQAAGKYVCASLDSEGFIHCSKPDQVARVANIRFKNRQDLILLKIDPAKLKHELKYENPGEGTQEVFPHIYGPLNLDAITSHAPFLPKEDGSFEFS
jgi:uncharacterized protein (DUF952 family)